MHTMNSGERHHSAVYYALAAACLLFLSWAIWVNARDGISSALLRRVPTDAVGLSKLDLAMKLSPANSRPYNLRALYLLEAGRDTEAERDFESAVIRRPHDYLLWLRLGDAREGVGDDQGAVAAYQESIRLAPSYAKPHWYLGTLWLRIGKREVAFPEMRKAARVEPAFWSYLIQYAWQEYKGDTEAVRRAVQPDSQENSLALVAFFLEQGKISEAMELYRSAGTIDEQGQEELLARLIQVKAFKQAYEVWARGRGLNTSTGSTMISNGGFENTIDSGGLSFDWRVLNVEKVRVARDPTEPNSGSYSLRLDFEGNSPSTEFLSQVFLVDHGTRYQLTFAARTQDLVTGGLPLFEVIDASNNQSLGAVRVSGEKTSGWQSYSLEFAATDTTDAVSILIKRGNCSSSPCPAFGHIWFDDVVCRKLGA
ncbi:MAG: hypothetical protein ACREA9_23745 [Pyrinomonadaceae bacterium]